MPGSPQHAIKEKRIKKTLGLLESWYVASKPVCGLTLYKLRSSVLTTCSSLKLSVLCERLRIRIVISGLLTVNHGFRFR